MEMHSVEFYRITRKQKKKHPAAKCYPQWVLNPGRLTLMPCMLLSELIPHLLEVSSFNAMYATVWVNSNLLEVSRPLDSYIVVLYWFQKNL